MDGLNLAELYQALSSGTAGQPLPTNPSPQWRSLPMSPNIDDRRGRGTSLADLAQQASIYLRDQPLFGNTDAEFKRNFLPSSYRDDIDSAARLEQFRSTLSKLFDQQDAAMRLEAYFRENEKRAKE